MANKNIRSGQILSPFGVGQIISFPKEVSIMVCGLHLWDDKINQRKKTGGENSVNEQSLRIIEPRLQKLLGVNYFVKPFPFKKLGDNNTLLYIPGVRFPKWHYCTNPVCGKMMEVELTLADERVECRSCKSKMIPVRFVAACEHGHIQDVPFKEWVHNGAVPNDNRTHILQYKTGSGSGDLGSIFIKCSCGMGRSLGGLMNVRKEGAIVFDSALARIGLDREEGNQFSANNPNNDNPYGQYCKGHQPWLGKEGINDAIPCGIGKTHLRVLIRGGSNIHYSIITSALFLPQSDEESSPEIEMVIKSIGLDNLRKLYEQDVSRTSFEAVLSFRQEVTSELISKQELIDGVLKAIQINNNEEDLKNESDLKIEEYEYILKGRDSENSDFKAVKKDFQNYEYSSFLDSYFEQVVLIERLKETRVFRGFSRVSPDNSDLEGKKRQLSRDEIKWLPAIEVFGEGIFLKFRDDIIETWRKQNETHFQLLIDRYHRAMSRRKANYNENPKDINAAFIMMHTFAHLLIKKLCFDCGYGSSSLKERIYFSSNSENQMNGILIYTSSGDSEGSLGGLVRQGKENFLGKLIKDSIEDARWCSADPVCSDIGTSSGQGPDNVNGSACHNCSLLPETSCEEFNMLLDRTSIIGTINNPEIGFFSS